MAFDSRYPEEQVDWARLVMPQTAEYDTDFILSCIARAGQVRPEIEEYQTIFDGKVALRPPNEGKSIPSGIRGWQTVSSESSNLEYAVGLLECWPEVYRQFPKIIHTIFPFMVQHDSKYGSFSAPDQGNLGAIYVSTFDPVGTSEALVHELAHQKLFGLGVEFESASRIVINPPEELYPSPLRGNPRPMAALLHATYAWLHIVALDLRMLSIEYEEGASREVLNTFIHRYLNRNIQILILVFDTVKKYIKCDSVGQDFFKGLSDWNSHLMADNHRLVDKIAQY